MATIKINGKDYDLQTTNWQDEINKAKDAGDYKLAAQYEQARNEKINSNEYKANGGKQTTTNNYAGWLDGTNYAAIGIDQMNSGASAEDVLKTYNDRINKASNTIGMEQYINDEHSQAMLDYIAKNMNNPSFDYDYENRPTYNDNGMTSKIDAMLNQILNRDAFSYNAAEDDLYKQYAAMYQREGTRAMNDAMASAAATAGGMNSYAMTAANQANNYYMAQLNDKIPELYQLAYEMYLQDIDNQVRDLGLLQQMDQTQYDRYRDTMSDWENDRNFAWGMYQEDMDNNQWQQQFDHNVNMDNIAVDQWQQSFDAANDQWQQEFDHTVSEDAIKQENRDEEWDYTTGQETSNTAYAKAMELLNAGAMPDAAMLKEAGMTESQAASILAAVRAEQEAALGGYTGGTGSVSNDSGSGGGNGSGSDKTGSGYDNGGMSEAQIKAMQKALGVDADGKWGSKSQAAAKEKGWGTSASAAWDAYSKTIDAGDDFSYLNRDDAATKENTNITFSSYEDATAYLNEQKIPNADIAGMMTKSEWTRRKASLSSYGTGGAEVTAYATYAEYLKAYVQYLMEKNGK